MTSSARPPPGSWSATDPGTSTSTTEIDLSADLGEGFGRWSLGADEALLGVVSSASVACGFHAGDPSIMRRVCRSAAAAGVAVGAHVAYRDLVGFGRRYLAVPPAELTADVLYQIGALQRIAAAAGTTVRYVKAHGALYNRCHGDPEHAAAVAEACALAELPVLCQTGGQMQRQAAEVGVPVVAEAFADRGYRASGGLAERGTPGALLDDPAAVAARAVELVRTGAVTAVTGESVQVEARSLCLHGDGAAAVELARAVRAALESAGIRIAPFTVASG